jgi:hypothetical protein
VGKPRKPSNTLQVASGLQLDADFVAGASVALLGQRGAGKTYACRVLAEELVGAHVQTVIVDPMGVFWGLRSSADGETEGLPIPVFGGSHGDVPLEPSAGALMADLVVDEGLSMILDLSGFSSRTQERAFAAGFFDRLYRTNSDLVHLIVDEADLFAPQKPRRDDAHLLVTMENIVRRGRNKGIGLTMATQRAAVLNKDVLTQVDALIAMRVAAPQDRDAIRDWVRGQGDEDQWTQIAPSLPSLANGEAWFWIPTKDVLQKAQIRRTRTFDSSPTRRRGDSRRTPKTFADVDLKAISTRMTATIERARATDPKELTRQIRRLETALAQANATAAAAAQRPAPVVDEDLVIRLENAVSAMSQSRANAAAAGEELMQRLEHALHAAAQDADRATDAAQAAAAAITAAANAGGRAADETYHHSPAPAASRSSAQPSGRSRTPHTALPHAVSTADASNERTSAAETVPPAQRRILTALATLETIGLPQPGKTSLALWAGVSPKSSGYANNLGALRSGGLIDYPQPGHVTLTDVGRRLADSVDHLVDDEQLHRKVQGLIPPARWRILEPLIRAYPAALDRDELATAAEVSASSSGYANNLGALRSLGLIDYPSPGRVCATSVLFLP